MVSILVGIGMAFLKREVGVAILTGAGVGWILSCFEKAITAEKIGNEEESESAPRG